MRNQEELTKEIKKLNQHLERLTSSGRHMIYSANPFKFSFFNFLAGIFHTLGSLFGYIVIFGLIVYLFSQINLSGMIGSWMEKTLGEIDWNRVMPASQVKNNPDVKGVRTEEQWERK